MVLQCCKWSGFPKSPLSPQGYLEELVWKVSQSWRWLSTAASWPYPDTKWYTYICICHKIEHFFLVFFQVEILQFRDRKYSSQMLTAEAAWTLWWPSLCVCIWVPKFWKRMLWSTINFCRKHRKENTGTYANICHCS